MQNYFQKKSLIPLLFAVGLVGCFHHFYKAVEPKIPTESAKESVIDSLKSNNRYFILRSGNRAFSMQDISIDSDKTTLLCTLDDLPDSHVMYLTYDRYGKKIYKPRTDLSVLNEVHIFTPTDPSASLGRYRLQLSNISKIAIIEKNKGKTTFNFVWSGIGTAVGVAALVGVISVATYKPVPTTPYLSTVTCSPLVYTVGNNEAELNGTLCSGAIYASLERTDYLPVKEIEKNSNELNFILHGGRNEELMLKDFQLMQVTHKHGERILVDKNGDVIAYKNPVVPEHAFIGAGKDVVNDLTAADGKYYSFNNEAEGGSSNVVLDFKKPVGSPAGKLIIRGKNSQWAYYVFNEFKKLYGSHYQSLLQKKDKQKPASVLQCEIDQNLPLLVSVKDGEDWKLLDYFFTPGNASSRDMIMHLDLK